MFMRDDIHIRTTASGGELKIPVFYIKGAADRPKVYIQANIHGPEIAGIGAIYDLLQLLRQEPVINGSLTIVPSVNPVGLDSKINGMQVGYADLNETEVGNFNRIYKMLVRDTTPVDPDPDDPQKLALDFFVQAHLESDLDTIKADFREGLLMTLDDMDQKRQPYGASHGQRLASIIQGLSYDADYLIDLHTAGTAVYHLFTFRECLDAVPYFDLPHTILLEPDSFAGVLDEAFLQPWLKLRDAFAAAGRDIPFADFNLAAFTPELGSADTLTREDMQTDAQRIMNYLRYKGVLEGDPIRHTGDYVACEHRHYRRYRATTGGLLLWHKQAGDRVRAGETMATILRPYAETPDGSGETERRIIAVSDGIMINHVESQVVHEGMGVCSVMTHLQQV